jgi:hypothetical protein
MACAVMVPFPAKERFSSPRTVTLSSAKLGAILLMNTFPLTPLSILMVAPTPWTLVPAGQKAVMVLMLVELLELDA